MGVRPLKWSSQALAADLPSKHDPSAHGRKTSDSSFLGDWGHQLRLRS